MPTIVLVQLHSGVILLFGAFLPAAVVDCQLGEQHKNEEANSQDDVANEEERLCIGQL